MSDCTANAGEPIKSGIYRITSHVDGRFYIGSAVNLIVRLRDHRSSLNRGKHDNARLQNAWNKYGESSFSFETLILCAKRDLIFYEQRFIDAMHAADRSVGFNICPVAGSQLGFRHKEETKARIRDACSGWKHTDEARARISANKKGKQLSPEARAKQAEAMRGRKLTNEHKAKISASQIGKKKGPMSEEGRANCSAWQIGRKLSDEHKRNIGLAFKGKKIAPEVVAKRWITRRAKMAAAKNIQLMLALDFE